MGLSEPTANSARIGGLVHAERAEAAPEMAPLHRPGKVLASVEGMDDGDLVQELALHKAARFAKVRQQALRDLIETGQVRAKRIPRGSLTDFRLVLGDLLEDLAPFRCRFPGCDRYGLGSSGCCSPGHSAKLLLAGQPRPLEVVEKITATKRLRFPVEEMERFCQAPGCTTSLGVKSVARVKRGDGYYCSLACAGAGRSAKFADASSRLAAEGRLVLSEVAGKLFVHRVSVHGYIRSGDLPAQTHKLHGIQFASVAEQDLKTFVREWVRTDSPYRQLWLDPAWVVETERARGNIAKLAARHGLTAEQAKALLRARVEDRRRRYVRHRAGARRKDALRAEWRRLFYELRPKLVGWSDLQVCLSVADLHLRTCADPSVWAKYRRAGDGGLRPEDEGKAARRIYMAIR